MTEDEERQAFELLVHAVARSRDNALNIVRWKSRDPEVVRRLKEIDIAWAGLALYVSQRLEIKAPSAVARLRVRAVKE